MAYVAVKGGEDAIGNAHAWLEEHERRFGLFIGGTWSPAEGETFDTLNPATGLSPSPNSPWQGEQ